ncbi:MAG: YfbU family protein [Deltaproteobacteria bacterium]|nr:YfbU family protein [Deltaproteobacteria bacterium]
MKLEKKDRLIFANQYRILELLDKQNASEHQKHREVVEGGFEGLYDDILGQVIDEDTVTEAECNEIIDTLSMFRALKQSFAKLDDTSGIDEYRIKFDGYDGNDETKFMAFARFFCERLGRFEELEKGDRFNSHCPMRPVYNRMRSVWNSFPSDAKSNISKSQIRDIAAAAASPK